MITIDYKPVSVVTNISNVTFTDSAVSKASVIYMDKKDAPQAKSLVWMQIRNPRYNPSDPLNVQDADEGFSDHPGNPFYSFRRWMWVEHVYSSEYPADYERDGNGDPVTNPDGTLNLGDW